METQKFNLTIYCLYL